MQHKKNINTTINTKLKQQQNELKQGTRQYSTQSMECLLTTGGYIKPKEMANWLS
jgi:hypothetical protein